MVESKYFDAEKLIKAIDETIDDQIHQGLWESTAVYLGVINGHGIKFEVSRDTDLVEDAEDSPNYHCLKE